MLSPAARRCALLVPSCDAYADLWRPFWTLVWRYWPDCPFPAHLGSDRLVYDDPRVTTLPSTGGRNWSKSVREQIEAIHTPYVLMMLEDFFLRGPVRTDDVLACLDAADARQASMIRLVPRPGPDEPVAGLQNLGLIRPGAPYRASTQAAIWRRDVLLSLLRDGESAWEFEMRGSDRTSTLPGGFYAVYRPVLTYKHHVVQRGKWFRGAARRFGGMDIGCDFSRRPIMSRTENLQWRIQKTGGVLWDLVPWPQRLTLRRWVRRLTAGRRGTTPGGTTDRGNSHTIA